MLVPNRLRWLCPGIVVAVIASCGTEIVAPDNSTVLVTAAPSTLPAGDDSALVAVVMREANGDLVVDRTAIVLSVTAGRCPQAGCGTASGAGALIVLTTDGIGRAKFYSDESAGAVTLSAASGKVSGSATITVSALTAPSDAKVVFTALPDTLPADSSSRILVFLTQANGSAVADGTRLTASATIGTVRPQIALTHSGFADFVFTASASPGVAYTRIQSGTVRDSVKLVVQ